MIVPAVLTCVSTVTGCGSGGNSSPQAAVSAGYTQALKYANCMRANGVPSFPDPSGDGNNIELGSGLDPQSPAFRTAAEACAKLQPGGGPAFPHLSESRKLAALHFARCMRAHGVPTFPDPTFAMPAGGGPVIALRGMFFAPGTGFNPRSPAVHRAASACGIRSP